MFLRLMLLVPMIRQFMLLDVSIMPDGSEQLTRMERERSEIPLLLARAMVNMHEHNWALAEILDLWTGERRVGKRWYSFGRLEHVYEPMQVVAMGFDLYLRSDGLVLHRDLVGSPDGRVRLGPVKLVSRPAQIDSWVVSPLHRGLRYLADYSPAHA